MRGRLCERCARKESAAIKQCPMLTCADPAVKVEKVCTVLASGVLEHTADRVKRGCSAALGEYTY